MRINSYNAQKYLTSDLNNITKEMSYLFPTLNSNNQLSFGQTVTPKCTNNLFRMKDKINTSRISTKKGGIGNMKWRCKGHRPLHGSPKLQYKFKELNKLNNQIEKNVCNEYIYTATRHGSSGGDSPILLLFRW